MQQRMRVVGNGREGLSKEREKIRTETKTEIV